MPILFVPNDPEARGGLRPLEIRPSRRRAKGRTDFDLGVLPKAQVWPVGSDEFLAWQCREALYRALATWERIAGRVASWQGPGHLRKVRVQIDAGDDTNAYYARGELGFYSSTGASGRRRRFAMSVDVVAHEAGHAFLDVLRPDLFDTPYLETNAFHEAFGDCMAILTSLADPAVRDRLLERDPLLSRRNFVETLMESLANATRERSPDDNAAAPRRARNRYRWVLPTELPDEGGPGALINEDHSFGQVFVGCFYDTLRNVFLQSRRRDPVALDAAARTVGKLLVRAADKAPLTPRFFQAIGRAMTLEDDALHARAHHEAIRLGFEAHGVLLGSAVVVAPRATLRGGAPKRRKTGRAVEAATLADLRERIAAAPDSTMRVRTFELGGRPVAEVCHLRPVSLAGLSSRLRDVVAIGPEPTLVGASVDRAALIGALPDARMTSDEVRTFVAGLVHRGSIAYDEKSARRARAHGPGAQRTLGTVTHEVVERDGRKLLQRLRFSCGCVSGGLRRHRHASGDLRGGASG